MEESKAQIRQLGSGETQLVVTRRRTVGMGTLHRCSHHQARLVRIFDSLKPNQDVFVQLVGVRLR